MTEKNEQSLKRDDHTQVNSEGSPYYLEVICNKDLHPFGQKGLPKENVAIPKQEPVIREVSSTTPDGKPIVPPRKHDVCQETPNIKEENFLYDAAWEDLHPYPLPAIPEQTEEEVVPDGNSTYEVFDELWDFPEPEWPESKRKFRVEINWNPLELKRKTICCLCIFAIAGASIIGMSIALFILMKRINTGKVSSCKEYVSLLICIIG